MSILNGTSTRLQVDTSTTSAEAQSVLNRMSNLSAGETTAITTFVDGCVTDGNWAELDEVFCFALNSTDAPIGFKSYTGTNNGGTHTANEGIVFDGGNDYFDGGFALSALSNYAQQDGKYGAWFFAQEGDTDQAYLFGTYDGTLQSRMQAHTNNSPRANMNKSGGTTSFSLTGFQNAKQMVSTSISGSQFSAFIDSTETSISASYTTNGVPTSNFYFAGHNNNGSPGSYYGCTISFCYVGSASIDLATFSPRVETLLNSLGVATT